MVVTSFVVLYAGRIAHPHLDSGQHIHKNTLLNEPPKIQAGDTGHTVCQTKVIKATVRLVANYMGRDHTSDSLNQFSNVSLRICSLCNRRYNRPRQKSRSHKSTRRNSCIPSPGFCLERVPSPIIYASHTAQLPKMRS